MEIAATGLAGMTGLAGKCEYWVWPDGVHPHACERPAKFIATQRGLPVLEFLGGVAKFELCAAHADLVRQQTHEIHPI
jgi:hypothetical protein